LNIIIRMRVNAVNAPSTGELPQKGVLKITLISIIISIYFTKTSFLLQINAQKAFMFIISDIA
ncbi:hypothetical protein ACVBKF_18100, partial [Shewanella sp. 0m-11]